MRLGVVAAVLLLSVVVASSVGTVRPASAQAPAPTPFLPPPDPALHAAMTGCMTATAYSKQAIDHCNAVLQNRLALGHMRGQALAMRAALLDLAGQSEAALADATAALELMPHSAELYHLRGTLHDRLFRYEEALADFDQVVRLNPNIVRGHGWRALTLQRFARHEEALAELNVALAMLPEEDHYYAMRGLSLAALGYRAAAARDFDESLRRNPDQWKALDGRSELLFQQHDYVPALRDMDRLIKLRPKTAEYWSRRASLLYWKGDLAKALPDHAEAIRLRPDMPYFYRDRCLTRLGLNQLEQAEADCRKAQQLLPTVLDPDMYAGQFLFKRGRIVEAKAAFERSLAREPRMSVSLYGRGVIRKRLGDVVGGDTDIAAAREMFPLIDRAWFLMGLTP